MSGPGVSGRDLPPPEQQDECPDDAALAWLTLKTWAGEGSLCFSMTENGDVGLYWANDNTPTLGVGDTCAEALHEAHNAYHQKPEVAHCNCVKLVEDGDTLP